MVDGEIVVVTEEGLGFDTLQQRLHPAESRVRKLAEETPASFVAFDLLALDDRDLTGEPFAERRRLLETVLTGDLGRVHLTPMTDDPDGRRGLVHALRGRRLRRCHGEAGRPALPAGQAGHVEGEARADGRLRGRRVPVAQGRRGGRLVAARPVRRRGHPAPRRRGQQLHGRSSPRARRRAGRAPERGARRSPMGRVGDGGGRGQGRRPHAGRRQPLERAEGPVMGGPPARARGRGPVRARPRRPVPPRRTARAVPARSHAGVVHLRAARGGRAGRAGRHLQAA